MLCHHVNLLRTTTIYTFDKRIFWYMTRVISLGLGSFFRKGGKSPPGAISLTSINLRFGTDMHAISGREFKDEVFTIEVPFHNKMGSGLLPDNLKGPDISINEITVEKPFELVEVTPKPPTNVAYMSSANFTLKIRALTPNYSGPLTITFATDSKDNVNIDVQKILLSDGTKKVEIEDTANNMILKKSQIIRRDIQVYKILKYGKRVDNIEVNKPFQIVSSEPAVPFTVDKKDSYMVKLFIKCPEFNYAGPLELTFV
jgi:hypothetical protein